VVGVGVAVQSLSTAYGPLSYRLARDGPGQRAGWRLDLAGGLQGLAGLRLAWPGDGALPRATLQGQDLPWDGRELLIPAHAGSVLLAPR
jgi:hypothetical protein